jgi:hypothetical protein
MTLILILLIALAVGVKIHSRWVMLLPVAVGALAGTVLTMTGHDLSDTPILFLVVMTTIAVAAAHLAGSRRLSRGV